MSFAPLGAGLRSERSLDRERSEAEHSPLPFLLHRRKPSVGLLVCSEAGGGKGRKKERRSSVARDSPLRGRREGDIHGEKEEKEGGGRSEVTHRR